MEQWQKLLRKSLDAHRCIGLHIMVMWNCVECCVELVPIPPQLIRMDVIQYLTRESLERLPVPNFLNLVALALVVEMMTVIILFQSKRISWIGSDVWMET